MNNMVTPDFSAVLRASPSVGKPKEMLSVVRQEGGKTLVRINSSSLSILQTCPRKAFYVLHQKWKSKAVQKPLAHGIAIHKALEVFYAHQGPRNIPEDFHVVAPLLARGHQPPRQHFLYDAILAYVAAADPLKHLPDDDKRSLASGVWQLEHYFKTYINDPYVIHVDDKGPVVEREFEMPLWEDNDVKIILFGTIDLVLKNTVTGEILPGDHKTSSQMGPDFFNRCKPNHQYTAYLLGAHHSLGITTENFMINGIQSKPQPKTSRGGPPTFTRQITQRTPEDFEQFHWAVRDAVGNYLRWLEIDRWPQGCVDACASWGGCQFLTVCSSPNELKQNILESSFEII